MTVLAVAQRCTERLQLPAITTLVGNTSNNAILLKSLLEQAAQDLRDEYPWPELNKEYTFTFTDAVASYALPSDFNRTQMETLWNRTQHWPLIGPLDAVSWQFYKSGIVATFPMQRFRIKGWVTNQFFIDPTPDSTVATQTAAYEYISATTVRPITWVASTSWLGHQYCSYNGNIYNRGSAGAATSGTTPPTHTSGSVSDGSITWTYTNAIFDTVLDDADEFILDNQMIIEGACWRFLQARGLDFEDYRANAMNQVDLAKTRLAGGSVLNVARMRLNAPMIGVWSYPQQDF